MYKTQEKRYYLPVIPRDRDKLEGANLEDCLNRYEREYDYAVRTPFEGIGYGVSDAKDIRERAKAYLDSKLEYLSEITRQHRTQPPMREYETALREYEDARDYERRASKLVWDRRTYLPRKAATYVSSAIRTIGRAFNWLFGRKTPETRPPVPRYAYADVSLN